MADEERILYFPVDRYYYEREREAGFLGERVIKYHRTLTAHLKVLLKDSLEIEDFVEVAAASGKCERPSGNGR